YRRAREPGAEPLRSRAGVEAEESRAVGRVPGQPDGGTGDGRRAVQHADSDRSAPLDMATAAAIDVDPDEPGGRRRVERSRQGGVGELGEERRCKRRPGEPDREQRAAHDPSAPPDIEEAVLVQHADELATGAVPEEDRGADEVEVERRADPRGMVRRAKGEIRPELDEALAVAGRLSDAPVGVRAHWGGIGDGLWHVDTCREL